MRFLPTAFLPLALSACGATVIVKDGATGVTTEMPASVYAHKLSTDAYAKAEAADAECQRKASTELWAAICKLGGKQGQPVPQYAAPPTFVDRVIQFTPLVTGLGGLVVQDRQNARVTDSQVALATITAGRELGMLQAATGSNQAIATGGFAALSATAEAAIDAQTLQTQAVMQAQAQQTQAFVGVVGSLPPTTQIIAGRDVIQARDVDQSQTGRDRDVVRNANCVASGGSGAPATAGNTSTSGGATSPITAGYNPFVTAGDGAAASNNCGGG
jgi:hypothetical protein